jgi:sigma-B regulation protein RsbU (phosphoserine phosphatase)
MGLSTAAWRRLLLGLCALGFVLTANAVWIGVYALGVDPGVTRTYTTPLVVPKMTGEPPFVIRFDAPPGSAAYRQGLRSGDLLDLRLLTPGERYRWINYFRLAGQRSDVPIERGGKRLVVSVVSESRTLASGGLLSFGWDVWLGLFGLFWMLVFAGVIAWRRSDSAEGRILSLLLSTLVLSTDVTPLNFVTPWPAIDALGAFLSATLYGLSTALLATYAMTFATPPNLLRRILMWLSYASAALMPIYGFAFVVGAWTATLDPMQAWYAGPVAQFAVAVLPFVFPVLCAIATIAQTRGTDRARLVWATFALGIQYFAAATVGVATSFDLPLSSDVELSLYNVTGFITPVVLTYVALIRRVLDVGFALNRAVVFSAVSLIFVGAFLLVEWALGEWLSSASHTTNLIAGAAIALALGLSVRSVHKRVDQVLDTIFFRKRHEDERVIRDFAHEASYVTDGAVLLARTKATLEQHADASAVAILLDDGHGRYGGASENDPAIVALKAWRKSVDLHALDSALQGEFAYPMVARGHLVGAIVLGPKRSGDPYAPDESEAILHMAHGVGGAIDVLSSNGHPSHDGLLEAIQTMSGELKGLAAEIHALRRLP